jgi:heme-degrading monooxygenase HmoA
MIVHITIHHPTPEKTGELLELVRELERHVRTQPGVLSVHTLKDESSGALVSLAVYSDKESWLMAQPSILHEETGEDFSHWDSEPPKVYHLEEI